MPLLAWIVFKYIYCSSHPSQYLHFEHQQQSSAINQPHLSQQINSLYLYPTRSSSHSQDTAAMNSQVWQPTRRVVVQTARSAPSISRGASSATSTQPFYQYASQGLRKLVIQRQEVRAPADWMGLLRKAGKGLPIYIPATAAAIFWPVPVMKYAESRNK